MGKKTRKERKNKTKVHIKVKREHIQQASEQLRKLYNSRFNTNIVIDQQQASTSDKRTESDTEALASRFGEVIDFYLTHKYSNSDLVTEGKGDPVKMAFNNLCESGIKNTINHAHECNLPPSSLKNLSLKGIYGIDLDSLQMSDSDDEYQNDREKLNEMVSKTSNLIKEVKENSKTDIESPPEAVINDHQKFF